ncbi:uncharacterized protein SAPINGB_P001975 [Magnusiomyces paraingens]|uniref:Alpha-1,3-glucosyltransferase n=1 Tax=Magnusiomyces paraingens TaxID=2606893 RepID=A0A5E8BJI7_9ASCO|nr:uncharacterized protein SAPINGB_P001975 [Saprochaete ingens]VVT48835.1 unnamed protein product [Saprochaete ingens]
MVNDPKPALRNRKTAGGSAKNQSPVSLSPSLEARARKPPSAQAAAAALASHATQQQQRPLTLTNIFIAGAFLKILLFCAYHSTDFEVHRNWLAITANLPLRDWYTEATSQWTLDYPPFFAYFEYYLTWFVPKVVKDDGALDIVEQGTYGWPTIVFQRTTVIITEIVLFLALQYYIDTAGEQPDDEATSYAILSPKHSDSNSDSESTDSQAATSLKRYRKLQAFSVAASIALSPGLLIIDHIHFQYNGFMYGILIFSLVAALNNKPLLSGALFAILLCFKHIYLYIAPAYFVYLLRIYVLDSPKPLSRISNSSSALYSPVWPIKGINWSNTVRLGAAVITPFFLAFAPFVYYGKIPALLSRLFPFSRGLTHAYWAPNIWAVYSFTDRILGFIKGTSIAGSTRGIVGDVNFSVLPEITPKLTFYLTLFYMILTLIPLFLWPTRHRFLASVALCGYASFLFGWHVHEKAILLVIFPLSFVALRDSRILSTFVPLTVAGYISLFPLIFTSGESLLKTGYTFVWFVMFHLSFKNLVQTRKVQRHIFLLDRAVLIYMVGFVPLMLSGFVLERVFSGKFEFAYLMSISVYCSIGVIGSWASFSWLYFFDEEIWL